ncbi:MAG: SiaB family protein kinase [Microscillaceae bacterium]|nr:SiaB family protein kinase [Microscillaceae bacterium]MDW8460495.1 SiaB family protein kinase [Cytophagales bacterium]
MLNVYDYFKRMQDENIILYFKGEITNNLLTSILQLIDDRLERRSEDLKVKRKVFSILLECLQNVYNYQQQYAFNEENEHLQSATLIIKRTEDAYYIITGNYMINERVSMLKNKIDKVNSLSPEELKLFYKEVINTQGQSDTGGAGLGIIDIARKSGEKIEYSFDEVSEKHCFYSLQVKVSA